MVRAVSTCRLALLHLWVLSPLLLGSAAPRAAETLTTVAGPGQYLGVETCGSSQCHGSPEPWRNATVLMKERLIWAAHDPHARAWRTLASDAGKRIARNLGLTDAQQAPECLMCHTTHVAIERRAPAFRVEDGVGCESCHGAGGDFLRTHVQSTATHAGNLAAGLYPTNEAPARARLCLSCHGGDAQRPVSHRLYGAGHPRLRFELDTYSVLQPYHFNPDADYRRRKPTPTHFDLWAAGQLEAAALLLREPALPAGLFPELARYDCHACHHALGEGTPRAHAGAPGQPVLADSPLWLLQALAEVAAPELVPALREQTAAFRTGAAPAPGTTKLVDTLAVLRHHLATRASAPDDGARALRALAAQALAAHPLSFMQAEALAMSLSTLLAAEQDAGRLAATVFADTTRALDQVYGALADETDYRPERVQQALMALAAALPSLATAGP